MIGELLHSALERAILFTVPFVFVPDMLAGVESLRGRRGGALRMSILNGA
jgi:hypothetical protein